MAQPNLKWRPYFDASKPVMQLFEDGDWLRIEVQGQPPRFLNKELGTRLLGQIGHHSLPEKEEVIVGGRKIII